MYLYPSLIHRLGPASQYSLLAISTIMYGPCNRRGSQVRNDLLELRALVVVTLGPNFIPPTLDPLGAPGQSATVSHGIDSLGADSIASPPPDGL